MLKWRKESNTYLTRVCRQCWSRKSPVWLSSAVEFFFFFFFLIMNKFFQCFWLFTQFNNFGSTSMLPVSCKKKVCVTNPPILVNINQPHKGQFNIYHSYGFKRKCLVKARIWVTDHLNRLASYLHQCNLGLRLAQISLLIYFMVQM